MAHNPPPTASLDSLLHVERTAHVLRRRFAPSEQYGKLHGHVYQVDDLVPDELWAIVEPLPPLPPRPWRARRCGPRPRRRPQGRSPAPQRADLTRPKAGGQVQTQEQVLELGSIARLGAVLR